MPNSDRPLDRRAFLRGAGVATAGIALSGAVPASATPIASGYPTTRDEPFPRTPDEALERLMEGNARFAEGRTTMLNRDLSRVAELAAGQAPFAGILACADSRVPPELVFDQGFGDLFVVRVAGNVSGPEEIASLEYTVAALGTQVVMVLGHESCGAVDAAMKGGPVPGQISGLFAHINPAIEGATDLDDAVVRNVRQQARVLRTSSPVMREALAAGRIELVGGVYDLDTGRVRLIEGV